MAGLIYRNTFGTEDRVVYSTQRNYHYQIAQALTERGYTKIESDMLGQVEDHTFREENWFSGDVGFIVHVSLKEGGKAVYFMTRDIETAEKVTEAMKLSVPGISLHVPVRIEAPE